MCCLLQVVKGMVLKRDAEGTVKCVENAKVAVYAQVRGFCLFVSFNTALLFDAFAHLSAAANNAPVTSAAERKL
jgi:hypothetical protein